MQVLIQSNTYLKQHTCVLISSCVILLVYTLFYSANYDEQQETESNIYNNFKNLVRKKFINLRNSYWILFFLSLGIMREFIEIQY